MPNAFEVFARELAALVAAALSEAQPAKYLYTVDDAAVFLACSPDQVRNFITAGKLRPVKIDKRPRFRLPDLQRFVDQNLE